MLTIEEFLGSEQSSSLVSALNAIVCLFMSHKRAFVNTMFICCYTALLRPGDLCTGDKPPLPLCDTSGYSSVSLGPLTVPRGRQTKHKGPTDGRTAHS